MEEKMKFTLESVTEFAPKRLQLRVGEQRHPEQYLTSRGSGGQRNGLLGKSTCCYASLKT